MIDESFDIKEHNKNENSLVIIPRKHHNENVVKYSYIEYLNKA